MYVLLGKFLIDVMEVCASRQFPDQWYFSTSSVQKKSNVGFVANTNGTEVLFYRSEHPDQYFCLNS